MLAGVALSLAMLLAVGFGALAAGASLHISIKPRHPKGKRTYMLTARGTAIAGVYGSSRNQSILYRFEQRGGTCAPTPAAESTQGVSGSQVGLTPILVGPGPFKVKQRRSATARGTTIRFCFYLEHASNMLDASATAAYKAR